jgi:hypothetical protein
MGLRPTNTDESLATCHSERSEESASSVLHRKSRSLATLPSTPLPSTLLRDAEQSRGVRDGEQGLTVGMIHW